MNLDELLDKVTATLVAWERTRNMHNLTDDVVSEGKKILEEG